MKIKLRCHNCDEIHEIEEQSSFTYICSQGGSRRLYELEHLSNIRGIYYEIGSLEYEEAIKKEYESINKIWKDIIGGNK